HQQSKLAARLAAGEGCAEGGERATDELLVDLRHLPPQKRLAVTQDLESIVDSRTDPVRRLEEKERVRPGMHRGESPTALSLAVRQESDEGERAGRKSARREQRRQS